MTVRDLHRGCDISQGGFLTVMGMGVTGGVFKLYYINFISNGDRWSCHVTPWPILKFYFHKIYEILILNALKKSMHLWNLILNALKNKCIYECFLIKNNVCIYCLINFFDTPWSRDANYTLRDLHSGHLICETLELPFNYPS